MSATAWAWLVLLFPLLGSIAIGLGFRVLSPRAAGAIGTAAIALAFACGVAALVVLLGEAPDARHHASALWTYASAAGLDIKLGILVASILFIELSAAILSSALLALDTHGPDVAPGFGDPAAIGHLLLERFLLPFEASSILLLIAAVGAIVLAGRKRETA